MIFGYIKYENIYCVFLKQTMFNMSKDTFNLSCQAWNM